MTRRRLVLGALLVLGTPVLAPAQSLWREGQGGLFADHRARAVNDVVTILIVEQSSSSRTAATKTSKDTSRTADVNEIPGLNLQGRNAAVRPYLSLDVESSASHEGKGSIDRTDRVSGQIAARVVKVLDGGNLVIEGRRAVLVNDETQVITVSGIVRPQDISGANTVLSSQIADAEIQMTGRGVLAEAQRPGILYRILDWLRIF
jgi:flagellar L-ring protein precursor FlgH